MEFWYGSHKETFSSRNFNTCACRACPIQLQSVRTTRNGWKASSHISRATCIHAERYQYRVTTSRSARLVDGESRKAVLEFKGGWVVDHHRKVGHQIVTMTYKPGALLLSYTPLRIGLANYNNALQRRINRSRRRNDCSTSLAEDTQRPSLCTGRTFFAPAASWSSIMRLYASLAPLKK